MLKKTMISFFYLWLTLLTLPCLGNGLAFELSPEEKAWIDQGHTVRVRINNIPPFMLTQGKVQGMAIDYLTHIFNLNGIKFTYISQTQVTWPQALDYIKRHKIVDLVPTAAITNDRKQHMIFTDEYLFSPWVIFTRIDADFVGSMDDLNGKTVSVEQGYAIYDKLKKNYPGIILKVVPAGVANKAEVPIRELSTGLVDAYIGNLLTATHMIQTRGYTNIKVAAPTFFENNNQAMAMRNDWPELASIINKTLAAMTAQEHGNIRNKWLSTRYEYGIDKTHIFYWLLAIALGAFLVIGTIVFWNRRLKAEIDFRKKLEGEIRQAQAHYRELVNTIPDLIWTKDMKGVYLSCNKTFELFFGAKEAAIIGKTDYDFKSRELSDFFRKNDLKALAAGGPIINEETLTFSDNGYHGVFETIKTPMYDVHGSPMGVLGIARDITSRKKAEATLKENERRYKKAQRMGHVGNWEYDLKTEIFWGSDEAKRIYGFDPASQEFSIETVEKCIPEREKIHQALVDLVEQNIPYDMEFEIQPITGPPKKTIRSIADVLKDPAGNPSKISGVIQDITQQKEAALEKKKLEIQLLHAQKIESIGTLAGGIAHDFNNILYPIIGFTEMSIEALDEHHPVRENLADILQGAKRASELVKQILLFSSQREVEKKPVHVQTLIIEALSLLRSTFPANIKIQHDLYESSDHILANPTEIHEIIMNLATNAYHAMEETGGTLTIHLNRSSPNPELNLPPGKYSCLSFSDTGVGIPSTIVNKIFDPYFTTKAMGKGSGLGLSVIHGIVKNLGGTITVTSEPGKGSVFRVYLPITLPPKAKDTAIPLWTRPGGNENILFVDDEETIVKLGIQLLERKGYSVTGKTNSIEALALFKSRPDNFDLVITDMSMPTMLGTEFAKKLLEIRPDIPIIVCSGFSEGVDRQKTQEIGIKAYIEKPVLAQDLFSKIRTVLDCSKGE